MPRRRNVPMILAAEQADCGLACLAMVAGYWGHKIDLTDLKKRFPSSAAGATLATLMDVGEALGLRTRPIRVEIEELELLQLPAVLHWRFDHFVVLSGFDGREATIIDPAVGARKVPRKVLSDAFTGVALELDRAPEFRPIDARTPLRLRDLFRGLSGLNAVAGQALIVSLALQVVLFALPLQTQLTLDRAISGEDADILLPLAVAFGVIVVTHALLDGLRAWTLNIVGAGLNFRLLSNVVHRLIRLPMAYFQVRAVGDVLSRVNSVRSVQEVLTKGVLTAGLDLLTALGALAIMTLYSPPLALIAALFAAVSAGVTMLIYPRVRRQIAEQVVESAQEQNHLIESVRGATLIKVLGLETTRDSQWQNLLIRALNAGLLASKWQSINAAVQVGLQGLQGVIILYLGARSVLSGSGLSIGMLVAFLAYRQIFAERANALNLQLVQFRLLDVHLERLKDILSEPPETVAGANICVRGAIELQGVTYAYGAGLPLVLRDLDLVISQGEFVAIVGASGAGKTTLVKLLLGLLEPSSGRIRIDGRELAPDTRSAVRRHIGYVAQNDQLLAGPVAENIAGFPLELDLDRVKRAAAAAKIADEIEEMPMGYWTRVGDMGTSLSGGQLQRVILARAIYRDPAILVLDEGTANLDSENEALICDFVKGLKITRIVVAHRPRLIEAADRVLKLEGGRLVEVAKAS